ncbi:Zn 2cys6 transcription factor [Pleurostoma richardsiae]|uniref:Zn 2cys6 transcription factor n=1 Tax=Pleurostoma richardsiae TaxID=41990 RepID=A0AA38VM80_9PEZI|nr:Zn 2cys6 transcription factor [Pleurostoma richardsiae]
MADYSIITSSDSGRRLTPQGSDTVVGSDQTGEAMHAAELGVTETVPALLPSTGQSSVPLGDTPGPSIGTAFARPVPSSRTSPEPSQTDRQGHYVGPASGVSFLIRVQKRLHQTLFFSQGASIFTFGDAPLPDIDPSFFVLPPRDEAQRLMNQYFDFAVPTHRFLHRPTVDAWLGEFYENMGMMSSKEDAPARTALLFMVFAQAKEYTPSLGTANDISARYFLMAEHQLSKERGGSFSHIDVECRRRVFWCAYSLDNYLSAALGRPRTFHDADIDAELPSVIDDSDLHAALSAPPHPIRRGQTIMLAPVAHVRLSRIVSVILRDLYPIRPLSNSARSTLTARCSKDLRNWRNGMARFLDSDGINPALLLPIYQRQRNVLNLAYWHAIILAHRPFLLSNFARLQQNGSRDQASSHRAHGETSVKECLRAAMCIAEVVDDLIQTQQMFRAFWFTSYFAFCAVVVLYVYAIQQSSSTSLKYQTYLDAATKCQNQRSGFAEKESLAHRYCLVLEELRLEAMRHLEGEAAIPKGADLSHDVPYGDGLHSAAPGRDGTIASGEGSFNQFSSMDGLVDLNPSPSSSLADITSWGNFDSVVTSGFGHLDALLNSGDSFAF